MLTMWQRWMRANVSGESFASMLVIVSRIIASRLPTCSLTSCRRLDPVSLRRADEEIVAARLDGETIDARLGRTQVVDDGGGPLFFHLSAVLSLQMPVGAGQRLLEAIAISRHRRCLGASQR